MPYEVSVDRLVDGHCNADVFEDWQGPIVECQSIAWSTGTATTLSNSIGSLSFECQSIAWSTGTATERRDHGVGPCAVSVDRLVDGHCNGRFASR